MERLDFFRPVGLSFALACADVRDDAFDSTDAPHFSTEPNTGSGEVGEASHADEPLPDTGTEDSGINLEKHAWACANLIDEVGVFDTSPSFYFSDTAAEWKDDFTYITHDVVVSRRVLNADTLKALAHLHTEDQRDVECYGSVEQVYLGEIAVEVDIEDCMGGDFTHYAGIMNVARMHLQLVDATCRRFYGETQSWIHDPYVASDFIPEP